MAVALVDDADRGGVGRAHFRCAGRPLAGVGQSEQPPRGDRLERFWPHGFRVCDYSRASGRGAPDRDRLRSRDPRLSGGIDWGIWCPAVDPAAPAIAAPAVAPESHQVAAGLSDANASKVAGQRPLSAQVPATAIAVHLGSSPWSTLTIFEMVFQLRV